MEKLSANHNLINNEFLGEIISFWGLKRLSLRDNKITKIPLFPTYKKNPIKQLEYADFSCNKIESIDTLPIMFSKIRYLNLSHNELIYIDPSVWMLPEIEELHLSHNKLYNLTVDRLLAKNLKKLNLSHNRISNLDVLVKSNTKLSYLNLSYCRINKIPAESSFYRNSRIDTLLLSNNQLKEIPASLAQLHKLELLDLSDNQLRYIPSSFKHLKKLKQLKLANNPISLADRESIRGWLPNCEVIFEKASTEVNKTYEFITTLDTTLNNPEEIKALNLANKELKFLDYNVFLKLKNLEVLHIENNQLEFLPIGFTHLIKLEKVQADHNLYNEHTINSFFSLPKIRYLDLSYNNIKSLASPFDEGREISSLEVLKVSNAQIESLSTELDLMPNFKYLDLSHNKITYIEGESVLNLKHLMTLNLSHNALYSLNSDIVTAYNLRFIDLSHNPALWGIHDLLNRLPLLDYLNASYVGDISWNGLSFGLPGYKKYYLKSPIKMLLLSHAHLSKLPDAMGYMENLEYLDLSHNKIERIPASFKKMKKLKSLLLMGNPISEAEQEKIKKLLPCCTIIF